VGGRGQTVAVCNGSGILTHIFNHSMPRLSDAWYLFSDGMVNDPAACVDYIKQLIEKGETVPAIHTVGFFPAKAGENFQVSAFKARAETWAELPPKTGFK
jgi:hypothetical protein